MATPPTELSTREVLQARSAATLAGLLETPGDLARLQQLLTILAALDEQESAAAPLQRARASSPDTARIDLLESVFRTHLGQHEAALTLAARASQAAPSDAEIAHQHGVSLAHFGRNHEALEVLHRAIELDGERADSWDLLATLYTREDESDQALTAARRAAALAPHEPRFPSRFAALLAARGDLEGAVRVLHEAVKTHPNDPELAHQLMVLLDRPLSAAFLAWISLWLLLMGVSLLLGVALEPIVGGICFLFLLVGMVVWGALFNEDSERSRLELASPGVTATVAAYQAEQERRARTENNPWSPPES